METHARLRLYQYAMSPYCISIELALRHSGIPYDIVNLNVCDPTPVIKLTKGAYYQVPVVEDLFNHRVVFDKGAEGEDVARFIAEQAPLMNLFPEKLFGIQRILVTYIENECEPVGFKVNDAHRDKWLKNDIERALHRRHKERKFGAGCLEEWTREVEALTEKFHGLLQPFEQILGLHPFLTGDQPVYADYVLSGVLGNFLYSGAADLPAHFLMLEAWYTKMRAGNFRNPLEDLQLNVGDASAHGEASKVNADMADLEKAIVDLKLRPASNVLDVPTGLGHAAAFLASKGFTVTAADTSATTLKEAAAWAAQQQVAVTFHEHGPEQLPYADGSFSLIVCRGAAHHLQAPENFIREATRVLKTYGFLVIIDGTVPDDHVEANAWMNTVERLRDPSHVKFITPNVWRNWCVQAGLTVTRAQVETLRLADLNQYFNEANTSPENRKKVLELVAKAPASARELFKLGQENGKIVWTWRRITLIAGKM
jgi:ubiquinone/menaquinone biosynthesis C-methylase UbiE/glutathione S-transferase